MGLRLANLDVSDCDRTPSKRDPRLRREVRASRGMLIRDIVGVEIVVVSTGVLGVVCLLGMLRVRLERT